jgi:hypothetical protein
MLMDNVVEKFLRVKFTGRSNFCLEGLPCCIEKKIDLSSVRLDRLLFFLCGNTFLLH